ncbi:Fe(3+) dicitrate transport protein [Mucilaginibacter yixingensis]|uniref:Fe(3+) dicitrate transport protein n=1 Tax=Mucilaginibacter yixingensis TaxID=1295612 RepID=A0A2T5JFL2_9SPHI|nr:TonB-dependent receptor [Mucilaginibacter yixingensis]PTR01174.1 Fe(3+) dicitrate transport protein [Mucilaginibacter yixingensis]
MNRNLLSLSVFLLNASCFIGLRAGAQSRPVRSKKGIRDTTIRLDSVTVKENKSRHLPDVQGTYLFAGKKTYSLTPDAGKANLSSSNIRQIFATIPGVNVWELSGNGFQMNIGSRGTDTHRSNETNVRQNGYITNSDIFGYPEDHYTPQYDAVEQIQIVRGAAALQFGSQFGGMVNYKIKEGDTSKVLSIQSEQSAGSNNYFNSFNAVGGKSGKWSYYAYFASRTGNGWRKDADFSGQWYYANLKYQFNSKGSIALQFSRVNFFEHDAGGLTDAQFNADPQQATRTRNYFDPEINIPALLFNYQLASHTKLEVASHGIIGQRNSVQYLNNPNVADTVNKKLNTFNPRQVDRDYYYGFTTEARLLTSYQIGDLTSTFTSGLRYFTERTNRKQKATGTTGSDYDLTVLIPYGIDLQLRSLNYAAFAENLFQITPKFSFTPGFRYEIINTNLDGVINSAKTHVSYENKRHFPLFGAGLQYQLTNSSQFYGNISQAYKPFTYANIIPGNDLAVVDPNLKDSRGYNIDLGYRGNVGNIFNYDFDLYYVYYGDRVGNLTETNSANQTYIYTTNIGNGVAKGAELYTQVSLWRAFDPASVQDIRVFNSFSYNHARYTSGTLSSGTTNISLKGNYLEGTPAYINRTGLTYLNGHVSTTLQLSYVSEYYTDANNTVSNPTGLSGIVPAYHVFDWSFNYNFLKNYHIFGSINNVLNAKYFTRRITILPGPGILPSDGRTFNVGFGVKL